MTLVEVVTATIVLGVAIPPLVALYVEVSRRGVDALQQDAALIHATALLEEIASKSFEDPDLAVGSFGTEEGSRAAFDDVDDFDGLIESPPTRVDGTPLDDLAGFTRSAVVDNVGPTDPDPASPEPDGSTALKRVAVTVSWTGGRGGELTLETLRARRDVSSPIDVAASVATLERDGDNKFVLDLINIAPFDLEIASFDLVPDVSAQELKEMKLDGDSIRKDGDGLSLPTYGTAPNEGDLDDRTIFVNTRPELMVEFMDDPEDPVSYTLVLYFANGLSSTLAFTVYWEDD